MKTMRKIMMAAVFSVLSLSACVDFEPGQTADPIEASDESPAEQPCNTTHAPTISDQVEEQVTDGHSVLSAIPCDDDGDCWSNVCDFEKHLCREYPF